MAETLEILVVAKDKASSTFKSIGNSMSSAFKVASIGAGVGLGAIGVGLAGIITLGMEGERVQAQLNNVIKSTGGVAGVTADEANALADSLSRVTKFSADTVIETESMLLTFTNIGGNVMPRATETVLDMATALGTDTQGAAVQLGKALNDPINGITALSRVGVTFTEEQKEQIKAMVEAGDVAGAQTLILDELGREFGNSARAAGDTFGGKLTILKNKLIDVVETLGMKLMPHLSKLVDVLIDDLLPEAEKLGERVVPELTSAFNQLADDLQPLIDQFLTFIQDTIVPFVQDHFPAIRNALLAVGALFAGAAIIGGILAVGAAIVALANPITLIVLAVAALAAAWTEDWGGIRTTLQPIIDDIVKWLQENIPIAIAALKVVWEEDLMPLLEDLKEFWDNDLSPVLSDIAKWLQENIPVAVTALKTAWEEDLMPALQDLKDFWDESLSPLLSDIADWFSDKITTAIDDFKTAWDEDLMPALQDLKDFWDETLEPLFADLVEMLDTTLNTAIDAAGIAIGALQTAFSQLIKPIGDVATEIGKVMDVFNDMKSVIPDEWWPGSPTAFEMGIRGIANSMRDLGGEAATTGNILQPTGGKPHKQGGTTNYNLTINSNAQTENLRNDFNIMRVWGGLN
jgi:hypothetical protein